MTKPNRMKRTLIGAHGERFYDIPGLIYPEEVLLDNKEKVEKDADVCDEVPPWGIHTKDAAKLLKCKDASARALLHKQGITHLKVRTPRGYITLYWHKNEIARWMQTRKKELKQIPKEFISTDVACQYLNVSTSTLHRYIQQFRLPVIHVRHRCSKGVRVKCFFLKSGLRRLHYHLQAIKMMHADKKHS